MMRIQQAINKQEYEYSDYSHPQEKAEGIHLNCAHFESVDLHQPLQNQITDDNH
jgi:hypothetical protein